jgi:hypothetical protein
MSVALSNRIDGMWKWVSHHFFRQISYYFIPLYLTDISSTAIILIDTNSMRPLFRFNIRDVSLLSPGYDVIYF